MQTAESITTLARLGLMDPVAAIETIIGSMQPADLIGLRSRLGQAVERRISTVKSRVKKTRLKELEAWHLQHGDRELVAQLQKARTWRLYEAKRTKTGDVKKGPMLRAFYTTDGLDGIIWSIATGQY